MSTKLSNAPVYYALIQAHFNPVPAMAKYAGEIQDRLRREYPLFDTHQVMELVVPEPGQPQPAEPQIRRGTSWLLARNDRSAGFILAPSAITFHTSHYDTHREFIAELLRGLNAVHEVVALDHVSRLGLRYLDAIVPQEGETVEQYLASGIHGLEFAAERRHAMSESVFSTRLEPLVSTGTLVVRVYKTMGQLGFPPDLRPDGLALNPKFDIKATHRHGVIDTDHYCEGRMPIDPQGLEMQLLSLHAQVKSVFQATVTDHARKVWA